MPTVNTAILSLFVVMFSFATTAQTLDEFIINQMSVQHIPGLSACIVKRGNVAWVGNYGFANISTGQRVTSNTIFMLASVAKTVTATALMQLYEKNQVQLDQDINDYLPFQVHNPFFPSAPITLRMLLTHTSSIADNSVMLDTLYSFGRDYPMRLDTFVVNYLTPGGQFYNPSINFSLYAPGSQWNYSNYAIALSAHLVEAIAGIPFDAYCGGSIFARLTMDNTAWFMRDLDTTKIARSYAYVSGTYVDYGLYGYPDYPDGQLRTTITSLAKFLIANIQHGEWNGVRILDSSTVALIRKVQFPLIESTQGIVWYMMNANGKVLWGHNGGDLGVSTEMFLSERDTTGVILLTNSDHASLGQIRNRLFQVADTISVTAVDERGAVPRAFVLHQNYPNPFNPSTTIRYALPHSSVVTLAVYNTLGQQVAQLVNEQQQAGYHDVVFRGDGLSSDVYFYRLDAGSYTSVKKLLLLK